MSSIIGIKGKNVKNQLFSMLDILNHRGPDSRGVYSNNEIFPDNLSRVKDSDFMLAYNYLSVNGKKEPQIITNGQLTLMANANIYNQDNLVKDHDLKTCEIAGNCELILKLLEKYYDGNLKESVLKTAALLDGEYSLFIKDNTNFLLLRDPLGIKPVYYGFNEDNFAFASEKKALQNNGYETINSLKPTHAILDENVIQIREEYVRTPEDIEYESLKQELKNNLEQAVSKRVKDLEKVALLFSAGVDSTILAIILKKLGKDVTLYTIGTQNSQDLKFAKKAAQDMDLPIKTQIIDEEVVADNFVDTINIIEDNNLMKIGVGMTIYLTSKLASQDKQKVILSGQGADELFCGYNRYKNKYSKPEELLKELSHDINMMYDVNLERDDKATMKNSIELRAPYFDKNVIKTALKTPIKYMLHSEEDKLRKHILRDVAHEFGVKDYIAYRPKKAAQYGTGIDKIIKKKIIKKEEFKKYLPQ